MRDDAVLGHALPLDRGLGPEAQRQSHTMSDTFGGLTAASFTTSGGSSQNSLGGRAPEHRVGGNNKQSVEKLGGLDKKEADAPPPA